MEATTPPTEATRPTSGAPSGAGPSPDGGRLPGRPARSCGRPLRRPLPVPAALLPAGALLLATAFVTTPALGQEEDAEAAGPPEEPPSIEEKTEGMRAMPGYLDLYWEEATGKLYLEIDRWGEEFLYQIALATGLGSNPVGLDRGQLGSTHLVRAERVGPRVLLIEPNYRYRALDADPAEVRAVEEAFAPSTLWGFEVVAETDRRALVDATDFFLRDAHDVARTLEERDQGTFELAADRSWIHLPRTRAFPENTEVEASLTFTSGEPGELVRRTAASGEAVTLRVHHSLVRLPEEGYEPREGDPRVGAFGITFNDYAAPIDRRLETRWVSRHRLRKARPGRERSDAVEPLVFHVDRGIPEPIRSAVIEGASWWEEAFRAAGFENAFRVELLPEGADPLDLRYNVIHWTHRRTRGWSYGSSVVDPRTGEILKANVNLGSLRLRQDRLLGAGLAPPYGASAHGSGDPHPAARSGAGSAGGPVACEMAEGPGFGYLADLARETTPVEMALARIRQLSAHEVGHTLGLAHNFAASTYGRASVMDYPAPLVRIRDGALDLSEAYDVGVGAYDRFAIRWLYSDFPSGVDEAAALDSIVRRGLEEEMLFLSDADARPAGAAHPLAGLWDNGPHPVEALRHEIEVRRVGLRSFDDRAIREGAPLSRLEEVFVPLYLHHRYQTEATAHTLAGVDYRHAVRGDGQPRQRPVPAGRQREALEMLLRTLSVEFLAIPERILELLPPPAYGTPPAERFGRRTAPTFDPLGVARSSADFTLRFLLQPERMARLVDQHARRPDLPGLTEVLERTLAATWEADGPTDRRLAAVGRTVERAVLERLIEGAGNPDNTELVRAELDEALDGLAARLEERSDLSAHERSALRDIRRWLDREEGITELPRVPELPPGSPIGGGG